MNKVELVGRLTASPKPFQTSTSNGCSFVLAISRRFKDKNGNRQSDFPRVVAWGKTADHMMKYGSDIEFVGIVGTIQTFTTEKDGKKIYNTVINADSIQFYGFKKKNAEEKESDTSDAPDIKAPKDLPDTAVFGSSTGDTLGFDDIEAMFLNDLNEQQ